MNLTLKIPGMGAMFALKGEDSAGLEGGASTEVDSRVSMQAPAIAVGGGRKPSFGGGESWTREETMEEELQREGVRCNGPQDDAEETLMFAVDKATTAVQLGCGMREVGIIL